MRDRGGVPYLHLPVGEKYWRGHVYLVRELRSVTRAARPEGTSGRQWTKLRKARQRAKAVK